MALHDNFRERIRRRRQELGLTQRAVAERMGVTPAFVTQAELGMNIPRLDTVERFAQALNCSSLELLLQVEAASEPATSAAEANRQRSVRMIDALPLRSGPPTVGKTATTAAGGRDVSLP